jgi:hypothetical protein
VLSSDREKESVSSRPVNVVKTYMSNEGPQQRRVVDRQTSAPCGLGSGLFKGGGGSGLSRGGSGGGTVHRPIVLSNLVKHSSPPPSTSSGRSQFFFNSPEGEHFEDIFAPACTEETCGPRRVGDLSPLLDRTHLSGGSRPSPATTTSPLSHSSVGSHSRLLGSEDEKDSPRRFPFRNGGRGGVGGGDYSDSEHDQSPLVAGSSRAEGGVAGVCGANGQLSSLSGSPQTPQSPFTPPKYSEPRFFPSTSSAAGLPKFPPGFRKGSRGSGQGGLLRQASMSLPDRPPTVLDLSSGSEAEEDDSSRRSDALPLLRPLRNSVGNAEALPLLPLPGRHEHTRNVTDTSSPSPSSSASGMQPPTSLSLATAPSVSRSVDASLGEIRAPLSEAESFSDFAESPHDSTEV